MKNNRLKEIKYKVKYQDNEEIENPTEIVENDETNQ